MALAWKADRSLSIGARVYLLRQPSAHPLQKCLKQLVLSLQKVVLLDLHHMSSRSGEAHDPGGPDLALCAWPELTSLSRACSLGGAPKVALEVLPCVDCIAWFEKHATWPLYLTMSLRTCRTLPVESQLCLFRCLERLGITLQVES